VVDNPNKDDEIVWCAPDGSFGGCRADDLTVVRLDSMTSEEREALMFSDDENEACDIIVRAAERIGWRINWG
jgi:hypothetical protein